MTCNASQWLAAAMLLWVATAALATGSCHKCGLCPAGTAANFWELGEPEFALGFGLGTPFNGSAIGDTVPVAFAETDCGTDLQVGGSCEPFCVYYNAYDPEVEFGSMFAATLTSNGWGAEGAKAGTYCGLGNYYQFYENDKYFFLCGAFPWKLCCRSPGYTPYLWPGPGFNFGLERSSADMTSPAITAPGQVKSLSNKVVDEIITHKTSGSKYTGQPTPAPGKAPTMSSWVRELVARKAPRFKN